MKLNTFSICGRCNRTGQLGIAVSTAIPNVGNKVPKIYPIIGAIASQAELDLTLSSIGFESLKKGKSANESLNIILSNANRIEYRQFGIVDNNGESAAWTGKDCDGWAGHLNEKNVSVQGNLLESEDVITNMYDTFQNTTELDLKTRLMKSLESGEKYGGDKRDNLIKSAALIIYSNKKYPLFDFRVNRHDFPVEELKKQIIR